MLCKFNSASPAGTQAATPAATPAATDSDGATIGDGLDIDYVRQYIRQEILKSTDCKAEANIYVGYLNRHNCYDRN